ncbi:histone-lysine N-methyltransferase SETMAR-like [Ptiloglossa arizonensis]|uniref:histone-lysine N-methyltransferase SETMAR-like n=1 Tax=Ptiloglossa arizonensis TaxID=3350558 RepID=UPI003F9F143B
MRSVCSPTTDTGKNICEVYGARALNLKMCQRWFSKFRKGGFELSDEPRSGRPTAFNPEALKASIELEPQLTIDEIAERLGSSSGTVHKHLIQLGKQNQTVAAEIYSQQLERLRAALMEKRPSLVNRKGVLFHHDNARPHTARITVEKIKNFNWKLLPHRSYSPDLAPSDYHLFRSMQHFLSGQNFNNSEDVKSALNEYFDSKSQKFFENGIRKSTDRWKKHEKLENTESKTLLLNDFDHLSTDT